MTRRKDVTDTPTNRISPACLPWGWPPRCSSCSHRPPARRRRTRPPRHRSGVPRDRWPPRSPASRPASRPGRGASGRGTARYHRYAFHCHNGRLTPRPPAAFSMRVNVGGHRLAISCRGSGPSDGDPGKRGRLARGQRLDPPRVQSRHNDARLLLRSRGPRRERPSPSAPPPGAGREESSRSSTPLLAGAGIAPPYILGGWSLFGFFNRLYTKRYPAEVRGPRWRGRHADRPSGKLVAELTPLQPPIDLIGGPGPSLNSTTWQRQEQSSPHRPIWARARLSD